MEDDAKRDEGRNLLHSARDGDAAATAEIDRLVRAFARNVCRPRGPGDAPDFDWEDVAQEATRRLLVAGFRQFRGTGSDRSYLYAVVKATVIQMGRSARRRRLREETVVAAPGPAPPNPLRKLDVRGILAKLDADCRGLIVRVLFRDEAYSTLAQELEITESAVRSRLHRCLEKAKGIAGGGVGA